MNKNNFLLLLTVLLMTLAITAVVSAGQPEPSTVYWWWGDEAGSAQIVRTPNGIHGNFSSSLANDSGSAHGLTVTLWLVIFNNPEACGAERTQDWYQPLPQLGAEDRGPDRSDDP